MFVFVLVITGAKNDRTGIARKIISFHAIIISMKDIILEIKRKAIVINADSSLTSIESKLIDLKQQIKLLDRYLDLKMEKN